MKIFNIFFFLFLLKKKKIFCEYIVCFIVCVWIEKRAIDPSQKKEKKKTEHRQLLSKSKQRRSILDKPTKKK